MAVKTKLFKTSGYYGKVKAIFSIIIGIILIIVGILLVIISKSPNPLILSGVGLIPLIYGWILWKRCNSLVQGRFW